MVTMRIKKMLLAMPVLLLAGAIQTCFAVSSHPSTPKPHHHRKPIHSTPHLKHHAKVRHVAQLKQHRAVASTPAQVPPSANLMASLGQHLAGFVRNTISTLRYTAYKLGGTHFDPSQGVYVLDCSDYVDHVLATVSPSAYLSLVNSSGSDKPTSQNYYNFFTGLSDNPRHYWNKVDDVKELQAGDILVFRNKNTARAGANGHVMVVMNKPIRIQDAFQVRVADSAPVGHSQDTRLPHTSGIGMGIMQLKANPDTGHPSAYAWRLGSAFKRQVNFAMARPSGY
jgi:cell wall-associated NlpC family hydrolase